MKIESGTGNGYYAAVDSENRLRTGAISIPRQHYIAKVKQKAFQVIGEATPAAGTVNVLHVNNSTPDKTFTITYIRLSSIDLAGGTALPNASNYFDVVGGLSYTSGGTIANEVNTFIGSTSVSSGVFYQGNPTLNSGTAAVLDKKWPESDGEEQSYNKEGSLVIPPGQSITIRFTGDHTSGNLYARVSFYVSDLNSLTV